MAATAHTIYISTNPTLKEILALSLLTAQHCFATALNPSRLHDVVGGHPGTCRGPAPPSPLFFPNHFALVCARPFPGQVMTGKISHDQRPLRCPPLRLHSRLERLVGLDGSLSHTTSGARAAPTARLKPDGATTGLVGLLQQRRSFELMNLLAKLLQLVLLLDDLTFEDLERQPRRTSLLLRLHESRLK